MNEKRSTPRSRTFLKGRVEFNNGQSNFECVVRDLSETGARIALAASVPLPEFFDVVIDSRSMREKSQMRWRHGDAVGVQFLRQEKAGLSATPTPAEAIPIDVARKIATLEAEVKRLRRLIEELKADPSRISTLLDNVF